MSDTNAPRSVTDINIPTGYEFTPESAVQRVKALESEVAALRAEVENWKESAALFSRNADFYRGLIVKIGETFGAEAKTADDGTLQDDVLALKVPELVEGMREGIAQLVERWAVIHDGADFDCDALVDEIRAYKESSNG